MGYSVYCHTNKTNGKKYVGITKLRPERRWANGEGYRTSRHFYFAIRKYGWDGFEHEVLFSGLTKEQACQKEIELIKEFRTNEDECGYNLSAGGQSGAAGVQQTEETKEKRAAKIRGRKHSEETRRKMSAAAKGRTFSEETRQKMSEAAKGKIITPEHRMHISQAIRGRKLSEETKRKLSEAKPKKRVYCQETEIVYNSIQEAARLLNLEATNIVAVCKGKHKHTKGYHFIYETEEGQRCTNAAAVVRDYEKRHNANQYFFRRH